MLLSKQHAFVPINIFLNLWKYTGWNSILYLAAIAGIDPQLYEAAAIDGANKFKQMVYVTIPGIMPTAIFFLFLL